MANIPAVGSNTSPVKLNSYLTESPEANSTALRRKALTYDILAKITLVAIVAIFAAVLIASYTTAATSTLPLVLVALTITTPFLAIGHSKLYSIAAEQYGKAAVEAGVAKELKAMANWKEEEVRVFFQKHGLSTDGLPLNLLKQINPERPLCALLPLIARYNYLEKIGYKFEQDVKDNFIDSLGRILPLRPIAAENLYSVVNSYINKGGMEAGIFAKLHEIGNWKEEEVRAFLERQGVKINHLPIDLLRQINKEQPLCALLPLIARFIYLQEAGRKLKEEKKIDLVKRLKEAEVTPEETRIFLIHQALSLAWEKRNADVIPNLMNAGLMLAVISQPTLQYRTIENLGSLTARGFNQHALFNKYFQDDTYFNFKDLAQKSITMAEAESDLTPDGMHRLLFPSSTKA